MRRELLARDRSDPGRYFAVVFFDSYESAMENSALPETQAVGGTYGKMSDSPPVFYEPRRPGGPSLGTAARPTHHYRN